MKQLLIAMLLGVVLACSGPTEVELRQRIDELYAAILALIGDPACDSVEECRYIAFGDKPCGGPWEYLVYSISQTDSVQLKRLVDEYWLVDHEFNLKTGRFSTCDLAPIPVLARRDGRCVDLRQ